MRLIVARCEVAYSGRLQALLPEALRLITIKSDGSVMVHADTGGYKPQNWMTPPTVIEEGDGSIVVRKRAVACERHEGVTLDQRVKAVATLRRIDGPRQLHRAQLSQPGCRRGGKGRVRWRIHEGFGARVGADRGGGLGAETAGSVARYV